MRTVPEPATIEFGVGTPEHEITLPRCAAGTPSTSTVGLPVSTVATSCGFGSVAGQGAMSPIRMAGKLMRSPDDVLMLSNPRSPSAALNKMFWSVPENLSSVTSESRRLFQQHVQSLLRLS